MAMSSYQTQAMTEEMQQLLANVQQPITKEPSLDDLPDLDVDNKGNPVNPADIMKDGKYGKKWSEINKPCYDVIYRTDKGYVGWVRSHINVKSSKEMQKLKLYIMHRDQMKKTRVEAEKQQQEMEKKQMVMTPKAKKTRPRNEAVSTSPKEEDVTLKLTPDEQKKITAMLTEQ